MQPCECGGRRFSVPTSFRGTTDIELDQDDHEGFDILDTDQGDGEWEENSTVRCIECDKQIPYAQWFAEEVDQPDTSAVPANPALELHEIGNTYVGPLDRFVVSLVVGYGKEEQVLSAKAAAAAALKLTNDGGEEGTNWYVYDRKTKKMHMFTQEQFQNVYVR